MRIVEVPVVPHHERRIVLGRRGENGTTRIDFDVTPLVTVYGAGTATLAARLPDEETPYPVTVTRDGNIVSWTVTNADTQKFGKGCCEIFWTVGSHLAKSVVFPTVIERDIGDVGDDPPDPYETWVEQMVAAAAEVVDTRSFVTPEKYGAVGDGTTDDTDAFQDAIDSGYPVFVDGTYLISRIRMKNGTMIFCTPNTHIYLDNTGESITTGVIYAAGSLDATEYAVDSYSADKFVCTETTFSVGDHVNLYSGFNTFATVVTAKDGNDYYVSNIIPIAATAVKKVTPIEGVRLYGNGAVLDMQGSTAYGNFIELKYGSDVIVDDFRCVNGAGKAVHVHKSYNVQVTRINDDYKTARGVSGKAESLLVEESSNVLVRDCISTNADRGFDSSGSYYCTYAECTCINARITCHGYNSRFITFDSCRVYGQGRANGVYGMTVGNASVSDENIPEAGTDNDILFRSCDVSGFAIGFYATAHSERITLDGCRFSDCNIACNLSYFDDVRILRVYAENVDRFLDGGNEAGTSVEISGEIRHDTSTSANAFVGKYGTLYLHDLDVFTNKSRLLNITGDARMENVRVTTSYTGSAGKLTNTSSIGKLTVKGCDIAPVFVTTLVGNGSAVLNSRLGKLLVSGATANTIVINNELDYAGKTKEALFSTDLGDNMVCDGNVAYNYDGADGAATPHIPPGGTSGQVLKKNSSTDFDAGWANESGGGGGGGAYWATYGTTTSAEIEAAYQSGSVCLCAYGDNIYQLAYRDSATNHTFACVVGSTVYYVRCTSNAWTNGSQALAAASSVPAAATAAPADLGTAAVGSSAKYAKEDHVHKMPTAADVGAGTYSKPSGGIPSSDMASAVQTSLGKADTAYQKPGSGIPASDLASGVIPTVPSASTSTPSALGTASAGSSAAYARGDHVHPMPSASDVGAIAAPSSPSSGQFLVYNGSAWVAMSLSTWQGGSY